MKPSTMTLPPPARPPSWEYFQDLARSASLRATLWPLPEEDMMGLITHGYPIVATAAVWAGLARNPKATQAVTRALRA